MARQSGAPTSPTNTKRPVTPLAGPYGHPFHPILVTVPIGLWTASLVFDVLSQTATDPAFFYRASVWLIGLGVVGALLAALFGFMDFLTIPKGTKVYTTGLTHMTINLVVTAIFAVSYVVRLNQASGVVSMPLLIASAVALAALGVSGWLGGTMTYRYGVRVVEQEDQAEGYRKSA